MLEAFGRVDPVGYAARKPAPAVLVTVTFITTPPTPVAGTPPRPVTCRLSAELAGTLRIGKPPFPVRVSRMRAGVSTLRVPPSSGVTEAEGADGGPVPL